ncbi:MAG: hypothetical protein P4L83_15475 [Nevskia sp.]|nr:hypothetical protein [Nevskia sp.]
MAKKKATAAEALLEAHVQFIVEKLDGAALHALVEREVDAILRDAKRLSVNDFVSRDAVKHTVRVYAVQLQLHAGIPELVADIARRIHAHDVHERTRLGDLMPDRQLQEIVDKLLEMKDLRERLLDESVSNPVYSALAANLVYHGIKGYLLQNKLTNNIPGARAAFKLGKSMMNRAPGLEQAIEDRLKSYVEKNIRHTLAESRRSLTERFDEDAIREAVKDLWTRLKRSRVSYFLGFVGAADVEDFFVIIYEYWQQLRHTEWYVEVIDAGIDGFFDRYGETSLAELLEEIGIERDMLVKDAMRFGPKAIDGLKAKGLLEGMVRRNLEEFYASPGVAKILKA